MPEQPPDVPITITHSIAFALPCPVSRGIAYLSDPAILLGALPSVERVVGRQRGTYRLTLELIRVPGYIFRPAAEVTIAATENRVAIQSVPEVPNALRDDEVPTQVDALLRLTTTRIGCDVRGTLCLTAAIPARSIPPLMPRVLAHRTAEGLLSLRMMQEVHAMARTLVAGFATWDTEQRSGSSSQQPVAST